MAENINDWSVTASSNDTADSAINWAENQTPGSVNGSARSMMAAIAKWSKDNNGTLTCGGSANAYTLASPNTNYTALTDGLCVCVRIATSSTGASTFNLNSLGAHDIIAATSSGVAQLAPGLLQASGHYILQYSAGDSAWILLNPSYDPVLPGEIKIWAGVLEPTGWLFCYGQAVSRTTYAVLFSLIATFYGNGDGSTTFNLPDLRGRSPFGRDDMGGVAAGRITNAVSGITGTTLGASGGAQSVTLGTTQIPSHVHTGTLNSYTPAGTISQITPAGSVSTPAGTISQITPAGSVSTPAGTISAITPAGTVSTPTGTISQITPAGTVSKPNVTITDPGHTHTKAGSNAGVAGATDAILQPSGTNTNIVIPSNTTGITAALASTPTFTGDAVTPTFTGSASTFTGTPVTPTFTGSSATFTGTPVTPTFTGSASTFTGTPVTPTFTGTAATPTFTSDSTGGGAAHTNMPPALILNFIIKT